MTQFAAPSVEDKLKAFERMSVQNNPKKLDLGALDSDQTELFRERNSWRNCIKKQMGAIVRDLQHNNTDPTFMADPNHFMKVMNRRIDVPHLLKDKT